MPHRETNPLHTGDADLFNIFVQNCIDLKVLFVLHLFMDVSLMLLMSVSLCSQLPETCTRHAAIR